MRRIDLIALVLALGVTAGAALPAAMRAQETSKVESCRRNLKTLYELLYAYMNKFGGDSKLLPAQTGDALWLALAKTDPPLVEKKSLGLFQCPVENVDDEGCDYRGASKSVDQAADGDVIGADVDGNHGKGKGGNVLRKSGDVLEVVDDDPLWRGAALSTKGGNPAVPPQGKAETEKQKRAVVDLAHLMKAVQLYREFSGTMPVSLKSLVEAPVDVDWWPEGGFIEGGRVLKDPWGHDYFYEPWEPQPLLRCLGADGKKGGLGEDEDLEAKHVFKGRVALKPPKRKKPAQGWRLSTLPEECSGETYVFSADGRFVAYIATNQKDKRIVMHNDKRVGEGGVGPPCLSADGKTVAYVEQTGGPEWRVVVGDKEWGVFNEVRAEILLTPDGRHFAIGVGRKKEGTVLADGREGPWLQNGGRSVDPVQALDGGIGYAISDEDDMDHVIVNGEDKGKFDLVSGVAIASGGAFAFVAEDDDGAFLFHDGKKDRTFANASQPALSADGKVLAFGHRKDGKWQLRLDGRDAEVAGKVIALRLSPDGKKALYGVRAGAEFAWWILDGGKSTRIGNVARVGITREMHVVFEPRVAWVNQQEDKFTATVDGQTYDLPDYIGGFHVTETTIGYGALIGRDVWWNVIPLKGK